MKKIGIVSLSLVIVFSISIAYAEMAKEGSATDTIYFTGTYQILAQEKENLGVNFDARGIVSSDDENNPFYNASAQCLGTHRVIKGEFKELGLCTYTRPDGDQIYVSYEATGKTGTPVKGTHAFIGGTGKCAGITGNGEFTRNSLKGPAKGSGANIVKRTSSWKLP